MYQIKDSWLVFNDRFNEPLSNVVFPVGIQKIQFRWSFDQEINNLPKSLIYLQIYKYGSDFKQSLNPYLYYLTSVEIDNNHKHKANKRKTVVRSINIILLFVVIN